MDFKRRNGGPFMGGGTQAKRSKGTGEWEDSPSQFEEELSMFDEEMDAEDMEGQAGHDVIPVGRCWTESHTMGDACNLVFLVQVHMTCNSIKLYIIYPMYLSKAVYCMCIALSLS